MAYKKNYRDKSEPPGLHPSARKKDFTKEQIINALKTVHTIPAAARYLKCSYSHLRKWMKFYNSDKEGYKNLLQEWNNRGAKGVRRIPTMRREPALLDILNGIIPYERYDIKRIRYRLCEEGYLKEECTHCGFSEMRVTDYKIPLMLTFKDGNKRNLNLENLEMNCYNCYFLLFGNPFSESDIVSFEGHYSTKMGKAIHHMGIDNETLERFENEKSILEEKENEFGDYDIVAFKYEKDKEKFIK